MRGRWWALAMGIMLASCAPEVQRAALEPAYPEVKTSENAIAAAKVQRKKLVFHSPRARCHVFTSDALNGDHHLLFSPVRGTYRVEETGRARLHMEIGMRDLKAEVPWIGHFAERMLASYTFPTTVIDANVEPLDGDQRDVKGNIVLRGVERGIHFKATVRDDGDGVRFRAVFDMSRTAFNIRAAADEGDALIRDDFTVTLEFHATPEHVHVETVDENEVPKSPVWRGPVPQQLPPRLDVDSDSP